MMILTFEETIVPRTIIYNNEFYDILYVDPKLIIKKYEVILEKFKVISLKLFNLHPNCNPKTKEFCLGLNITGHKFEDVKKILPYMISIYNIDNCYFSPWKLIKYKKQEVCA